MALYSYEPGLRDVFAEGHSDARFIEWFLRRRGFGFVGVYHIDVVEVPDDTLTKYGLRRGERGEVIALAYVALESLPNDAKQVTCIVDRDTDEVLKQQIDLPNLIYTDHVAFELYAFSEETLDKVLSVFAGGAPLSAAALLAQLTPVLQTLFAMRVASQATGLNLAWLDVEKSCELHGHAIKFDHADFEKRYLMKGGKIKDQERFRDATTGYLSKFPIDPRASIHGHDFVELLSWYLTRVKARLRGMSLEALTGALLMAIENEKLDTFPAFQQIIERISA